MMLPNYNMPHFLPYFVCKLPGTGNPFAPATNVDSFLFMQGDGVTASQAIGTVIPVTHFLRVVRGALLKGLGISELWPSLAALTVFVLAVSALAMARYRTTLD